MTKSGRTRNFESLCEEFWAVFDGILYNITNVRDLVLQKLKTDLDELRKDFNIDVHQLGNFKKQVDLINVREDIQDLVNFLSNLHGNM